MMKYHYVLMLLVCVVAVAEGKKYCTSDDDCTELGDLFCIKSQCDLGVCGCPRGEAAVFLGSENKFGCAKVKRIGESCSTDGDGGVCGAENSECKDGKCACTGSRVSQWNGERCGFDNDRFAGETCSPDDAVGTCVDGTTCRSPDLNTDDWYSPDQYNVPTCACDNNQKLVITNEYSDAGTIHPFVSASYPTCVARKIGDSCFRDVDCPSNLCTDQVCVCPANEVPNYDGTVCSGTPLGNGDLCFGLGTCDGSQGLVCGDPCVLGDAGDAGNIPGTNAATCTCGPKHKSSGSSCAVREVGDSCSGDYNCKGFSERGICVDGTCQNAGFHVTASVSGMVVMLLFALLHNLMF